MDFGEKSVIESPLDLSKHRTMNEVGKDSIRKVLEGLFEACDGLEYNPRVTYLGLYLWIRSITLSSKLCAEFSLGTILMAAMRLAVSYTGEDIRDLRSLRYRVHVYHITPNRRIVSRKHEERSPKREVNCTSSILYILEGRTWLLNPGDIRHLVIKNCEQNTWNKKIDETIFSVIMLMLVKTFAVPDAQEVIHSTQSLLYKEKYV